MQKIDLNDLLNKYDQDKCTPEELALLETWYAQSHPEDIDVDDRKMYKAREEVWTSIASKLFYIRHVLLWPKIAAAAVMLVVLSIGLFFYFKTPADVMGKEEIALGRFKDNDIAPGGNKAYLTLANGKRIALTDAATGQLAKEAGVKISKTADGQLVYSVEDVGKGGSQNNGAFNNGALNNGINNRSNAIETPKGGQYQILLPDGTKVWLNAASKLTYPVSFSGRAERKVELTGEAYFEVAKDAVHPFKVKSAGQEVEVLGTHFNINSYKDETAVKTTLLEGSVKVSSSLSSRSLFSTSSLRGGTTKQPQPHTSKEVASSLRFPRNDDGSSNRDGGGDGGVQSNSGVQSNGIILKPGQQSAVAGKGIQINEVNVEDVIAWKNGNLIFNDEDLQSILREVARWYDIEIVYEGQPEAISLIGKVSRSKHISAVLTALEQTGRVHFKVEGRRVTVMK